MSKKQLAWQLPSIIISCLTIIFIFLFFNSMIYLIFTSRCASNFGTQTQAKIIEVENYLPFDENSKIYKLESNTLIEGDLPILDGATALLPVYSSIAHAIYPKESVIFENGKYTDDSSIRFTDTKYAYQGVVDGDVDIIICAGPSKDQAQYAKDNNVELVYVPIGYEAFVFINHIDNPVTNLTVEQVRDIYTGKITNWSQVGGPNKFINPLTRPDASGSQATMVRFMNGREIKKYPYQVFGASIGFSFRFYVEGLVGNSKVKLLSINGVEPTKENIASKKYPISVEFYAVYRKDNDNPNIQKVIDFILSDEGQEIIDKTGYVKIK